MFHFFSLGVTRDTPPVQSQGLTLRPRCSWGGSQSSKHRPRNPVVTKQELCQISAEARSVRLIPTAHVMMFVARTNSCHVLAKAAMHQIRDRVMDCSQTYSRRMRAYPKLHSLVYHVVVCWDCEGHSLEVPPPTNPRQSAHRLEI